MKSFLLTVLAFASSTGFLLAQHAKISGFLLDSAANKPAEFATVALLNEGKPIHGVTADAKGLFVFHKVDAGDYSIQVSLVGYTTKTVEKVTVVAGQDVEIGIIRLSQTVQKLAEVTVTEQKALFEEKSDRMVYNAEKDISIKGGDATDVLKKIPSIAVDIEGNVQLRGSSNIKVLVNNKPSSIVARSISDALKQIPADIIK